MKIIRLAAALLMLRDKILYVTSGDYRGFRTLLQNCRIVICHRTNVPITYNYLEKEIKIDTIMAWEIM